MPGDPFVGTAAIDGDATPWIKAPVGQEYLRKNNTSNYIQRFTKRKTQGHDNDWGMSGCWHCISQFVERADFTDGGSTSGTLVLNEAIPEGAFVFRVVLRNVVGFAGDTSAALQVGDGTDADRYNVATDPDVFSNADAIDGGAPQGVQIHTDAANVTLTITSNADFTNVSAGSFTIHIFYLY
jgi:hypothetical protein